MKYALEIKEEAVDEISDAFTWYEEQKEGLGSEFVEMLESYFDKITTQPLLYPLGNDEDRVVVMKRFPYKVVFELEDDKIVVYAVFHTSRAPEDLER